MRQLRITLTDDQYEYAKSKGKLWLRDVVQAFMDKQALVIGRAEGLDDPHKKPWWRFW